MGYLVKRIKGELNEGWGPRATKTPGWGWDNQDFNFKQYATNLTMFYVVPQGYNAMEKQNTVASRG